MFTDYVTISDIIVLIITAMLAFGMYACYQTGFAKGTQAGYEQGYRDGGRASRIKIRTR